MIKQAMIFAAGMGTRMGALTENTPKPLLELGGQTLLDHALCLLRDAGIANIVVNTHYLSDQIARHLKNVNDVTLIHENERPLETGGGLKNALGLFDTAPIITLNADLYFAPPNPLPALLSAWDGMVMDSLLLMLPKENAIQHKGAGDFDLTAPVAQMQFSAAGTASHIFSGAQIINPEGLTEIPERIFSIKVLWQRHAEQGRFWGMSSDVKWVDVGHPDGLAAARVLHGGHDGR